MNSTLLERLSNQEFLKAYPRSGPNQETRADLISLAIDFESECSLLVSGAWLLHGFLDESHSISQDTDTPEGSFWHAIMHRLEGDFWNSKYWYRRVGKHPVYESLSNSLSSVSGADDHFTNGDWDPETFVDLCEESTKDAPLVAVAHQLARLEWQALFDWCRG